MAYNNYHAINRRVMIDTKYHYETNPILFDAVKHSIQNQKMVSENDIVNVPDTNGDTTYIVSGKRSFEAAANYNGKKTAVLSFANNHSIGGAPFSAGAQEESLCRCSTLFPCLEAMETPFYKKHQDQFSSGEINYLGNDDLIYTPDVVVFKKDERTDPIEPQIMPQEDWYKVNVITCAAPILKHGPRTDDYEQIITRRIKRILDVAAAEQNEVLILGAWGCGDYQNPIDVVAKVFVSLLQNYNFETVEFALSSGDGKGSAFDKEIQRIQAEKKRSDKTYSYPELREKFSFALGLPPEPSENYSVFYDGNRFGFFINGGVARMGGYPTVASPIGPYFGYSEAYFYDIVNPSQLDQMGEYYYGRAGYLLLGAEQDWSVYSYCNEFTIPPLHDEKEPYPGVRQMVAHACSAREACLQLAKIIGVYPRRWINLKEPTQITYFDIFEYLDDDLNLPQFSFAPASPNRIDSLKANQIFVFGSNLQGRHGAGAAAQAFRDFGAIWGQGVGLQGKSYAIPTMQGPVDTIKPHVDDFLKFAGDHPEMEFLVTRIGCGIATFKDADIAPLFANAILYPNVRLPQSFIDILKK